LRQTFLRSSFANLHIEVGYDDFAEDAQEESQVEGVVVLDFVGEESVIAVTVCEGGDHKVECVGGDKSGLDRAHRRVAVYFSQLRQDEISVHQNIDDEAQFVEEVQREEHSYDLSVVEVVIKGLARLEGEVKVTDHKLDLVLDALDDFEHLSGVSLIDSGGSVGRTPIRSFA